MNYSLTSRTLYLVLPLTLAACTIPKSLGENPGDETTDPGESESDSDKATGDAAGSTAESGSTLETSSATESTTDGSTTGGGSACQNPAQMCGDVQVDCVEQNCGAIGSPFDAEGCLRKSCDDSPCDAGEVCFADENAGCSPSVIECGLIDGVCACNSSEDCGGRYCYPEGEVPPTDCNAITDADACVAAGCQAVPADLATIEDDMCEFVSPITLCVWFPGGGPGTGEPLPEPYYHQVGQQAVSFYTRWDVAPYGWTSCYESGASPTCECWFD